MSSLGPSDDHPYKRAMYMGTVPKPAATTRESQDSLVKWFVDRGFDPVFIRALFGEYQ